MNMDNNNKKIEKENHNPMNMDLDIDKELKRMTSMEPYHCSPFQNPPVLKKKASDLLKKLENLTEKEGAKRGEILSELFGTYHPLAFPGPGFKCDYGFNIHFHGLAVINYNVVMLDTSPINIGAGAFIAPGVVLACSGHALHPSQRSRILTSAPITLEDNVWLGANVTVVGGVKIGGGSVIGAGSVVTKDIPAGVIAGGVPCKVIREITEDDLFEE